MACKKNCGTCCSLCREKRGINLPVESLNGRLTRIRKMVEDRETYLESVGSFLKKVSGVFGANKTKEDGSQVRTKIKCPSGHHEVDGRCVSAKEAIAHHQMQARVHEVRAVRFANKIGSGDRKRKAEMKKAHKDALSRHKFHTDRAKEIEVGSRN